MSAGLPEQLQGELNQPRRTSGGDSAEIVTGPGIPVGELKLRVVPGVKQLRAKLRSKRLADWKRFRNAEVPVVQSGSIQHGGPAIAKTADRRYLKTGGVEPTESVVADVACQRVAPAIADSVG